MQIFVFLEIFLNILIILYKIVKIWARLFGFYEYSYKNDTFKNKFVILQPKML